MMPNPKLIPRINIDYTISDLIYSLLHLINSKDSADSNCLKDLFPDSNTIFTNSGRTSLYLILKSLNLPHKSNIGIPLYTCPSTFNSIIHAGHIPVFLDVDLTSYTLDITDLTAKINKLDAIVVVHIFGRPADMHRIMEVAGPRPVIEDCAHALLSRYEGKLVGTMGVAGYFSFRTGKYLSAGEGSLIVTSNVTLANNIHKELDAFPEKSFVGELKHAVKTYLRSALCHRPWFGLVSLPLGSLIEKKVDLMEQHSFKVQKIRKTDRTVILRKLTDFNCMVERQRENSFYLMDLLADSRLKLPVEKENTYCNYFLFPVLEESKRARDELCDNLRDCAVDTTKLFSGVPEIARHSYGYSGDCPNTEFMADRIMTVPSYYKLTQKEIAQ